MDVEQYLTLDATALAALVAAEEVSAGELLAVARRRLDEVNPVINAVVAPLTRPADERAADPGLAGPFAGVPFLIKDLAQEYAGFPTTSGSRSLARDVATEHALVTDRFLHAGLVIFGKTNTPEFGAKAVTESDLSGPARNPWNVAQRRAGPPAAPVPRWRRGSCPRPGPTTGAARSGSPPRATASSG